MLLAIVGVMMFTFAGSVMALVPTSGDVEVNATVDQYAQVTNMVVSTVSTSVTGNQVTAVGNVTFGVCQASCRLN